MPNERHQQSRPIGDTDLGRQRKRNDANIVDGGVGPDETNRLGGLGNTSDGVASRDDEDPSVAGDHMMGDSILDTDTPPKAR